MTQKDILHFWRNVEIFNLPDLDVKNIKLLNGGNKLPWETDKSTKKDKKRIYTLFFGKVSKENVIKQIEELFPDEKENQWKEKTIGFTCLSSIILDEKGCPDAKSYTLASFVLGLDVLKKCKEISSVYGLLNNVSDEYLERFNILKTTDDENPKGNSVTWEFIEKEIAYLRSISQWNDTEIKIYFTEKEVGKNIEVDPAFLNSFFLDDLNQLIDDNTELSPTVQSYLTLQPTQKRFDLIKNKKNLFNTINPEQLTEGKWPSTPKYGLCTAQLGAVNTIFKELGNSSGIQGINGPPGTGKTTLLLDVIAQVILDRAKAILNIGIDNLFEKGEKIDVKDKYLYIYPLNAILQKNYGIVVASNNNSAVENISKELPQAKKIDKYGENAAFPYADYFGEYAKEELTGDENWGILAAALGNSKNKNKFNNLFWKSFLKDEKGNLIRNGKNKAIIDENAVNFYNYLVKNQDLQKQHQDNFEIAKKEFISLLEEFKIFKNTAIDFHNRFDDYSKNVQRKTDLEKLKDENKNYEDQLNTELQKLTSEQKRVEKERDALKTSLDAINTQKPIFFFFHKLFNTQSFVKWNNEINQVWNEFNNISLELKQINNEIKKVESEKSNIINRLKNIQIELEQIEEFKREYENLKTQLCKDYQIEKVNIFDENFYNKDLKDIHLLSPYHSEKIAKLRSKIFLKALDVHKFTILANAKQFKNNLNAFFDMILGRAKVSDELTTTLWDTFFFCIPVVSTSLASASRLFPNMIKNQIGWLLIDEAGQATPQSAVGLIQRSKRCVIVGDPLQVEPVVTIPKNLVDKLISYQNVKSNWSPYNTSVQQLADRISQYGTLMGNDEYSIWTGFPLRTHRRCFNPMFDIANEIAYNNQMVKGTEDKEECEYIGVSCWFDVKGSGSGDSQVIREEIELLKVKVDELRENGYKGKIYVISPFKLVANECERMLRFYEKVQCGTIHTFQGKEADVVFLVLGSHPEKEGTRKWTSSKPNMLNVALTRAKKRCYVIGSKELWSQQPYFDVMINKME
ncbi:MAG: ATP-binding protein [Bacteroidota bacterium]|nr:ATP-binding protein [Bacteroidota bacterium]